MSSGCGVNSGSSSPDLPRILLPRDSEARLTWIASMIEGRAKYLGHYGQEFVHLELRDLLFATSARRSQIIGVGAQHFPSSCLWFMALCCWPRNARSYLLFSRKWTLGGSGDLTWLSLDKLQKKRVMNWRLEKRFRSDTRNGSCGWANVRLHFIARGHTIKEHCARIHSHWVTIY